ncbi:MAG TPA: trypsin-like peptidase domain-containing protein [Ktedonobacteraceae bacterium]
MFAKMPQYIAPRRRNQLLRIVVVAGLVCLTILAMAGNAPAAYADGIPGGNISDPVVRAVDIAKPAVVRIITFLNGQLTVHFPTQDATFPQGGNGYQIVLSGSGTFITARGEILTADHVVNPPRQDLDQFVQQQAAPDVAAYMNQVLKANPSVSADQVTAQLASGQLRSNTQYNTPQSRVYLSTDFTGPLNVTDIQNIPANLFAPVDRIEKQSSFTDRDIAIIHVSNMNDMAMVQLGNSSSVQQQDELTIIGFPGNGDIAGNSATDLLTLSVNKVIVSSLKTTDAGAPLIQVGGNVEHGDSGGPALDNHGAIVGIVSFGASGQGNTSFLQASNSASALVQSLRLDTSPGKFQQAWSQAFTDYASNTPGHWHKVQIEFEKIAASYPLFKAVKPYLDYATAQAKIEKVPQTQPSTQPSSTGSPALNVLTNPLTLIGAGFLLLAVVLLFGVIVLRRRHGKKTQVTTSPATSFNTPPPIAPPVNRGRPISPSQSAYGQQVSDALTAFGAPPSPAPRSPWPGQPPAQSQPGQSRPFPPQSMPSRSPTASTNSPTVPSTPSGALVHWPCGHLNRPVARYCSVCGEPAPPTAPARKFEQ